MLSHVHVEKSNCFIKLEKFKLFIMLGIVYNFIQLFQGIWTTNGKKPYFVIFHGVRTPVSPLWIRTWQAYTCISKSHIHHPVYMYLINIHLVVI